MNLRKLKFDNWDKNEANINLAVIVADDLEYVAIHQFIRDSASLVSDYSIGEEYSTLTYTNGENQINVTVVFCGNGKVNAAAATAKACTCGADLVLNVGMSGGLHGIGKNQYMLGEKFYEHDFDLTPRGFKLGQKDKSVADFGYKSSEKFNSIIRAKFPNILLGNVVSGDSFISSDEKSSQLVRDFGAMSCDMESAAVCSVCNDFDVPFAALRKVSDFADDSASDDYTESNKNVKKQPLICVLESIGMFFDLKMGIF